MLQYLHIKQNADLIKSFYALGVFMNASELQDVSVEEIQVDEIEYGGDVKAYDCRNFIFYYSYD